MIGQTLGHYRIEAQLGAGGMGVVYRAYDTKLQRTVALKLVGERLSEEPTARERLLREARTASALNHPHICTVHEVGEADGQVYIAMEYVEGRPLSQLDQVQPAETVIRYGIQIADALAHAHDRGIVHRDLKTSNVVVTTEGRTKVLDFGLAKRLPKEDLEDQPTRSGDSLTEAGSLVGTLHFLAPELLRGQPADARSDIWALGVLLHELASGELPFQGKTRYEVTYAIQGQPPRAMPPEVPAGLRAVIQRCLEKEPGERYQRASEVRAALEAIQSGSVLLPQTPRRRRLAGWVAGASATVLALLLGVAGYRFVAGQRREIRSIAVLPFANVGGDPDNEFLSDGIPESVVGSLSRLPKLKMIAFGSVLRYKSRPVEASLVGRELGVAAVVIGRVTQHRDGLLISAELIDTRDGSRLWGDQYQAKPGAFLSVQQEISRQISDQLRTQLSGADKNRVTTRYAGKPEAYELYLKGHYYTLKYTPAGYEKAIDFFRRAIEEDSGYAPAWAGLSGTYVVMTMEGLLPPGEGYAQGQRAAARALELDDTDAEAHLRLGQLEWYRDWDWPGAEAEFRRALALEPDNPFLRRRVSQYPRALGRWDEALALVRRAAEGDPLSVETNEGFAATYYWAGRYDEALEQGKKALELDPDYGPIHQLLADVYARKGLHKEAVSELQKVFALNGDKEAAEALGQDFATLGYEPVMRHLYESTLDQLTESAKERYVSPFSFAVSYAKLGNKDQAFAWLEKAYVERSPWLTFIKADPDFDKIRPDPRFAELTKRMGLP